MSGRERIDLGVLAALGAGIVAVTVASGSWELSRDHPGSYATAMVAALVLWAAASAWVLRRRPRGRWAMGIVLVVALAARLALVPHAPDLSGDINRYVWDGGVTAQGINPYRFAPEDPRLAPLRDDAGVYPGINRKPVPTIYPPAAQDVLVGLHLAGARGVTSLKLAFSLIDLVSVALLALLLVRLGLAPERSLLYAWHPLAISEIGRSGHIDVIAILLIVGALLAHTARRPIASGSLLAGAALVKFYAAAMLPALLWIGGRRTWQPLAAFALTVVMLYAPYLGVGSGVLGYLPGYLDEEGFDSGRRFYVLNQIDLLVGGLPGAVDWALVYQGLVVGGLAWFAWRCVRRAPSSPREAVDRALLLLLLLLLLSTPTYPWYLLLTLALVPVASARVAVPAAIAASGATMLYLQWWLSSGPGWPLHLTWGAGLAALGLGALRRGGAMRSRTGRGRTSDTTGPVAAR